MVGRVVVFVVDVLVGRVVSLTVVRVVGLLVEVVFFVLKVVFRLVVVVTGDVFLLLLRLISFRVVGVGVLVLLTTLRTSTVGRMPFTITLTGMSWIT